MSSAASPANPPVVSNTSPGPTSTSAQGKSTARRVGRARIGGRGKLLQSISSSKQNQLISKERIQTNAVSYASQIPNQQLQDRAERPANGRNDRLQERQEKLDKSRPEKSEKLDNTSAPLNKKEKLKHGKAETRSNAGESNSRTPASTSQQHSANAGSAAGNDLDNSDTLPNPSIPSPQSRAAVALSSPVPSTPLASQLASPNLSSPAAVAAANAAAEAAAAAAESGNGLVGSLDEYRQGCLRLEKARHARMYDAERRLLYHCRTIRNSYDYDVRLAEEEFDQQRRYVAVQMLRENSEKMRRVEELRYKIVRDEVNGLYSRRHEMSLRGRAHVSSHNNDQSDADIASSAALNSGLFQGGYGNLAGGFGLPLSENGEIEEPKEKPTRRGAKKKEDPAKHAPILRRTSVNIELDEEDIQDDLAKMTGEKRPRQETAPVSDPPTRKNKKRK